MFVSLKKAGQLRGCIGTIEATQPNLLTEIQVNAVRASTNDPRFWPLEEEELDKIAYSVDILGPIEPIDRIDSLDVKNYGVIVEKGNRLILRNKRLISLKKRRLTFTASELTDVFRR